MKLDNAEQNERQRDTDAVAAPKISNLSQPKEESVKDSILDILGDESFEDLPPSQGQFQEQILESSKRRRMQVGDKTSTPKIINGSMEPGTEANSGDKASRPIHRNIMDQLKRTMVFNAAAPSSLSRTIMLKEAVVSEEISVAKQAIETASAETTDLGPFFGLPTKVKDLMLSLRGIKNLYGICVLFFFNNYKSHLIFHALIKMWRWFFILTIDVSCF